MNFYHGSPVPGLQLLQPAVSRLSTGECAVCMSSLPAMALLYGIRHFEYTYGYRWKNGKPQALQYIEYFPGALRELYGQKEGWLYLCEDGDYRPGRIPNEYLSTQPVPVRQCTRIPDLYEELRARERAGELEILPFEALSPALKEHIQQGAAEIIAE
ncbi:MAG: hypothetical protein PUC47_01250 [Oscillospiraceae bacterium]|nr:hypothetical protein [Oscillospiraceae bacterium]